MATKDPLDTKIKIMGAAFELFGKFGFDGTSVREISRKSSANLAAINYYFTNKENLFWEIMHANYRELDGEIKRFYENSADTLALGMATFDHFTKEKYSLKNVVKMMLAEGIQPPTSPEILAAIQNPMGPPGGKYFAEMIQKEVPYKLSKVGSMWGVKAVFGTVMHWGMMCSADHICNKNDPLMSTEQVRQDVEAMIEAQLLYLKANSRKFGESV